MDTCEHCGRPLSMYCGCAEARGLDPMSADAINEAMADADAEQHEHTLMLSFQ